MQSVCYGNINRICWYQHGWRHANHELRGKKEEFGKTRSKKAIAFDLDRGRKRLRQIMQDRFYPAFTPPWNRCSLTTLDMLVELNYQAISRDWNAVPVAPDKLPDFPVNVDLHTRKDVALAKGWQKLAADMERAIGGGYCGIMIHHRCMNDNAFRFLEVFLGKLVQSSVFHLVNVKELVAYE
jgi:hypothetical protein